MSHKAEASVIGRLLAGYGELEYVFALCLANALGDQDRALKTFFIIRGESIRIDVADSLMRDHYIGLQLTNRYKATVAALRACRNIRNVYAHCHWANHPRGGLFYVNLEKSAERKTGPFTQDWLHVDVDLLITIEMYFRATKERLWWLDTEHKVRTGAEDRNVWSWPKETPAPTPHNPRDQHPPPWKS